MTAEKIIKIRCDIHKTNKCYSYIEVDSEEVYEARQIAAKEGWKHDGEYRDACPECVEFLRGVKVWW